MGSCVSQCCGNCCQTSSPSQCCKRNSPSQGSDGPMPSTDTLNSEFPLDSRTNKKPSRAKFDGASMIDVTKKLPSEKFDSASLIHSTKELPSVKFDSASLIHSTKKISSENFDFASLIHSTKKPFRDKVDGASLIDSTKMPSGSKFNSASPIDGTKKPSSDKCVGTTLINNMKSNSFSIHKYVFTNDLSCLSSLLQGGKIDVSEKDKHGNTALHLGVMLGRKECIQLLLDSNAPVDLKNNSGWSSLDEAISYGDRQTISNLLRSLIHQADVESRNQSLDEVPFLKKSPDFTMELKWEFSIWVPLLSRILPNDIYKISKKGASIRLDTTLVSFSNMKWKRGDITLLYREDSSQQSALYLLDNKAKVFKVIHSDEDSDEDRFGLQFEEMVDSLMSSPIERDNISTKPITFSRAQSGWYFKVNRSENVGKYKADFYDVNGMSLRRRSRWEHLSEDGLQKTGAASKDDISVSNRRRGESLIPPCPPHLSWDQYLDKDSPPILGRQLIYKEKLTPLEATIAMSKDIPLKVNIFIAILEAIDLHFEHLKKLKDFIGLKLPPGFPVKVDLPIKISRIPTIKATVTINDFQWRDNLPDHLFNIPEDYREKKDLHF